MQQYGSKTCTGCSEYGSVRWYDGYNMAVGEIKDKRSPNGDVTRWGEETIAHTHTLKWTQRSGLHWISLDFIGLYCIALDCIAFDCIGLDNPIWIALNWIELNFNRYS